MNKFLKAVFVLIFMGLWTLQFNDYFEPVYVKNIIGLLVVSFVVLIIPSSSFIINTISAVAVAFLSDFLVNTNSLILLPIAILLGDFKFLKSKKNIEINDVKIFDISNIVLVVIYAVRLIVFRATLIVTPIYEFKVEHFIKIMCLLLPLFIFSLKPLHKEQSNELKICNHMLFFSIVMFIFFNTTVSYDFSFVSWTLYACVLLIYGNPTLDFCIEKLRYKLCI